MKKFITSSLVTITALSGLAGTVGSVSASSIVNAPSAKTISPFQKNKEVSDDLEAFTPAAINDTHVNRYLTSSEISANNIVNDTVSTDTTKVAIDAKQFTIDDGFTYELVDTYNGKGVTGKVNTDGGHPNITFDTTNFFETNYPGIYYLVHVSDPDGNPFELFFIKAPTTLK